MVLAVVLKWTRRSAPAKKAARAFHSGNIAIENNDGILDTFHWRLRGRELALGTLDPVIPHPAREGLTFRDLAERHGWSRMKACRLIPLTRLAPDIRTEVASLTTTAAGEPIDRDTLVWIAEAPNWAEQRERFDALAHTWRTLVEDGPLPSL